MFITLLDSEQVICTRQINLGEDRRTIKNFEKLIHRRNRILVLTSNSIEFAVINTQTEATIFHQGESRVNRRRLTSLRTA
ncbi:hypothetical protein O181_117307, partial [Austropuccinia psidii MF-1]|nr:hypothetical protein [Austropuccinia psidii MF-1]